MPERIPEKVQVFVSSTIKECAAERGIAKRAIESLNHDPILFEHIGARSVTARDVYIGKLDVSHIFIGIYRKSYGWLAPGARISGIEDEYQRASQRGMSRLVYVLEPGGDRDPRLTRLIETLQSQVKYAPYTSPNELFDRIRDDVEAEVARRLHQAERLEAIVRDDVDSAVTGLVPTPKTLLERNTLAQELVAELSTNYVLQVAGDLGIGKSVFLAATAKSMGFWFVSATQLTNHELASVIANKCTAERGEPTRYFTDAAAAFSALREGWATSSDITLVLDDVQPDFVAAMLRDASGVTARRRLIYSLRNPQPKYGHKIFTVPPLSSSEVAEFLKMHDKTVSATDFDSILQKSGGNPLYLLYFAQGPDETAQKTLAEYELDAWRKLPTRARELLSYLAIADQGMSLRELLELVGRPDLAEEVTDALLASRTFVVEFSDGYSLRHEHQKQTIVTQLSATPSKRAYYSNRVARLFSSRGDYSRAYFVVRNIDQPVADQLSRSALFDSQRRGDFKSQLLILDDILRVARQNAEPRDLVMLLLSKAMALQHTGRSDEVRPIYEEVEAIAAQSTDPLLQLRSREARAISSANLIPSNSNIGELEKLEKEYLALGDEWSAGRITTELSVLFTRTHEFPEALAASERGLKIFEKLNDDHGVSISTLNMALAMTEIPERHEKGEELIRRLEQQRKDSGSQRECAWFCNYMVRSLRRKGKLDEALRYGQEAVNIAEKLGDLRLAASNHINLGNVFRDRREPDSALSSYSKAGELAHAVDDRVTESTASRLTAAIYRRQQKFKVALDHAQIAATVVKDMSVSIALCEALEEVGDCLYGSREWAQAADAYAAAAATSPDSTEKSRLMVSALEICVDQNLSRGEYAQTLDKALGVGLDRRSSSPMNEMLSRIGNMLSEVDIDDAIRLFGLHFKMIFKDAQSPVARFLFRRIIAELLKATKKRDDWHVLLPAMPLLLSPPLNSIRMQELVALGDQLQSAVKGFHFKPKADGSIWTIRVDLRQPVLLIITCLDFRLDTFVAAALTALFFKGFETEISEMLTVPQIPNRELDIYIGNVESMPHDIRESFPSEFRICAVTRPADPKRYSMPTFVVCSQDIADQWESGTGSGSAAQVLLGEILIEASYQFLQGEVDLEVIKPKVINLMKRTIS